jgi:2-keto-4-pentenoate hydratase/2-oxohepta-3-ene-1,7-dioic acid hydratase in catechol pathway
MLKTCPRSIVELPVTGKGSVVKSMRLCSFREHNLVEGGILLENTVIPLSQINSQCGTQLPTLLQSLIELPSGLETLQAVSQKFLSHATGISIEKVKIVPPYVDPHKIWGIGLNYRDHASDLGAQMPTEPASFMKPRTAIVGHKDTIILPRESQRVTAEAELGVIIGRTCKNITEEKSTDYIFGYVPILDMTAEDILQKNPRFLTRAKSFDTFFSFGPFIITKDEITDVPDLTVSTVLNDNVVRSNKVRNMTFSPNHLVAFHSHGMTLEPGDIISTGTPGAGVITQGDVLESRITGFHPLLNYVKSTD